MNFELHLNDRELREIAGYVNVAVSFGSFNRYSICYCISCVRYCPTIRLIFKKWSVSTIIYSRIG